VGFGFGSGRLPTIAVSVTAAMAALVLRDAYKSQSSLSAKQIVVDLVFPVAGVLVSQIAIALAAPPLLLRPTALTSGSFAFFVLFLLRLQNPTLGVVPRRAMVQAPATMEALMIEVRLHERLGRRAIWIEALTGLALAVFFIVPLVYSTNWFLRIGWGLAVAYGLYVAAIMLRHRTKPMPEGLGFRESIAHYRRELVRQHGFVQTMWFWYLLPGVPAIAFIMIGAAVHAAERGRPAWPAAVMAVIMFGFGAVVHFFTRQMADKVQARIDALRAAEDQRGLTL